MIKWRRYLERCPFRDKISVEKAEQPALRRPFGDGIWIEKYCVPDGTPWRICASVFYRYHIPNGIAPSAEYVRHSVRNASLTGCGLYMSGAYSTERCIPNGMRVQRGGNIVSTERCIPNGMPPDLTRTQRGEITKHIHHFIDNITLIKRAQRA